MPWPEPTCRAPTALPVIVPFSFFMSFMAALASLSVRPACQAMKCKLFPKQPGSGLCMPAVSKS